MIKNISKENFSEAWAYLDKKRRMAKKLYVSRLVAEPVSQGVFFILFMGFAFSALVSYGGSAVDGFLDSLPYVMDKWKLAEHYFQIESLSLQFWLLTICKVYLLSITASVPFVVFVLLVYYPFKKIMPTVPELYSDAASLAYREYSRYHKSFKGNMRNFCGVFCGVILFSFAAGFFMYLAKIRKYHTFLEENASRVNMVAGICALLLIAAYLILNLPLYWLIRFGLRNYIPARFRDSLDLFISGTKV